MTDIKELEIFFSEINTKLETANEIRKEYNKTMANDFNIFNDFFCLGENKITEILAFFLNPEQTHGQGKMFLNLFVNYLGSLSEKNKYDFNQEKIDLLLNGKNIIIECERVIENNRRIDLIIEFDSTYAIAIENKIWAKDQHDQLKDYNEYLQNKKYEKDYILFYLNPYHKIPSELSISKEEYDKKINDGNIAILDYQDDIISILYAWKKECEAERVRYFLNDLIRFLEQEINGINIMENFTNYIAEYVIQDEKRLKSALELAYSINKIKENLKDIFYDQLRKIIDDVEIKKNDNIKITLPVKNIQNDGFYINVEINGLSCYLQLYFISSFNHLIIGFLPITEKRNINDEERLDNILTNRFNLGIKRNINNHFKNWASVFNYGQYFNFDQKQNWLDIKNEILIKKIKTDILNIVKAIETEFLNV